MLERADRSLQHDGERNEAGLGPPTRSMVEPREASRAL
jgi:hypothetical protein